MAEVDYFVGGEGRRNSLHRGGGSALGGSNLLRHTVIWPNPHKNVVSVFDFSENIEKGKFLNSYQWPFCVYTILDASIL